MYRQLHVFDFLLSINMTVYLILSACLSVTVFSLCVCIDGLLYSESTCWCVSLYMLMYFMYVCECESVFVSAGEYGCLLMHVCDHMCNHMCIYRLVCVHIGVYQ